MLAAQAGRDPDRAPRAALAAQEARLAETREVHAQAQAEYNTFRERLSGLRAQLNAWHRQSAELHNQREEVSRELAVLEERRRSLLTAQATVLAEQERSSDEERIARERLAEVEQEAGRLGAEYDEGQKQFASAQQALQIKQSSRTEIEEKLLNARAQIEKWNAQRAESQARLDELKSRLESLQFRLEAANKAVETYEVNTRPVSEKYAEARKKREEVENQLRAVLENEKSGKWKVESLETERRAKADERANRLAEHTRLKAQLEVLEQAEQSLAGYAEGARFLLDAARQSRLKGTRGALSAALDVPAELERAIAAALGDTLDAVLLDASEIEEALQLLESDEVGRAVLLPLAENRPQTLPKPADDDILGVASELVHAPDELRAAVQLVLGQTLIVRDRATARRLRREIPTHARLVTLLGEVFRGDGLIIAGKSLRPPP